MSLRPREGVSFAPLWAELEPVLEQLMAGKNVSALSLSRLHHQVYVLATVTVPEPLAGQLYAALGSLLRRQVSKLAWSEYFLAARRLDAVCAFLNRLLSRSLPAGKIPVLVGEEEEEESMELRVSGILELALAQWRQLVLLPNRSLLRAQLQKQLEGNLLPVCEPWLQCGEGVVLQAELSELLSEHCQGNVALRLGSDGGGFLPWAQAELAGWQARLQAALPPELATPLVNSLREWLILQPLSRQVMPHLLPFNAQTVSTLRTLAGHGHGSDEAARGAIDEAVRGLVVSRVLASFAASQTVSLAGLAAAYAQDCEVLLAREGEGVVCFGEALRAGWTQALGLLKQFDLAMALPRHWQEAAEKGEADHLELVGLLEPNQLERLLTNAWRLLAKRLLSGKAAEWGEREANRLAQLWREVRPDELGLRMQRMLQDEQQSRILQERFPQGYLLRPLVCSWGTWPLLTTTTTTSHHGGENSQRGNHCKHSWEIHGENQRDHLPPSMAAMQAAWQQDYAALYPRRRLTWLPSLSRVTLNYTPIASNDRTYELQVTQPMASLLLWLAEAEAGGRLAVKELAGRLGVSEQQTLRLAKGFLQIGLLLLTPKDDCLVVNEAFSHPRSRLKILPKDFPPLLGELAENELSSGGGLGLGGGEGEGTAPSFTSEERKHVLQALLVRLFKSEQELSPERTIHLCLSQQYPEEMIKEALGRLVEKGFLELDPRRNLYIYLP